MENRKGAAGDREPESLFQRLGRQLRQVFLRQLALGLLFLAGVLLGEDICRGPFWVRRPALWIRPCFSGVSIGVWGSRRPRLRFPCTG